MSTPHLAAALAAAVEALLHLGQPQHAAALATELAKSLEKSVSTAAVDIPVPPESGVGDTSSRSSAARRAKAYRERRKREIEEARRMAESGQLGLFERRDERDDPSVTNVTRHAPSLSDLNTIEEREREPSRVTRHVTHAVTLDPNALPDACAELAMLARREAGRDELPVGIVTSSWRRFAKMHTTHASWPAAEAHWERWIISERAPPTAAPNEKRTLAANDAPPDCTPIVQEHRRWQRDAEKVPLALRLASGAAAIAALEHRSGPD